MTSTANNYENSCKLVAKRHNELSKEKSPTCTRLYPTLEMLMSNWENLLDNDEFEPFYDALCAVVKLLEKYYQHADDTDAYFISHSLLLLFIITAIVNSYFFVLDPTMKLTYLDAAWKQEYIDMGMVCLKKRVCNSIIQTSYHLISVPVPCL